MNSLKRCFLKMLSYSIRREIFFVSLAAVLLTGCTLARMEVCPQLVSVAEEMKVEGRKSFSFDETFFFGPYQVAEVHRGWTRSTGFSISTPEKRKEFTSSKAKQKYEFILEDGKGDVWTCQSVTGCNENFFDVLLGKRKKLGMGMTSTSFVCTFKSENRPEVWRLTMNENFDSSCIMKGILSDGETSFLIQATHKLAGDVWDLGTPSGYEFLMKEDVVGSVEVNNKGAVWIVPTIKKKLHSPLAVTSAALLLFQDIGRT
ncbi:MAG: hypothetical protein GY774_30275 [Planctomycetes bacterium]|nr:hypothetical protein [Planctomycetota bacterium]